MHLHYLETFEINHRGKKVDCLIYLVEDDYFKLIFSHSGVAVNINVFMHGPEMINKMLSKLLSFIDANGFEGYINLKNKLYRHRWINENHLRIEKKIYEIRDVFKIIPSENETYRYPTVEMEDGKIEGGPFFRDDKFGILMSKDMDYSSFKSGLKSSVREKIESDGKYPKITRLGRTFTKEYTDILDWFFRYEMEILLEEV